MFFCAGMAAGFLAGWAMILAGHFLAGGPPPLPVYGLAYAALAALGMACTGRCLANWHPALRRMSVLMVCAALAGVDAGVSGLQGESAQKMFFAALLGIALVTLAARHVPAGLRRRWLGKGDA